MASTRILVATKRREHFLSRVGEALEGRSFELQWCFQAERAERLIERRYADLVITNGLPEMDLGRAVQWLRALDDSLPVVAVTTPSDVASRVLCLELGAADCVTTDTDIAEVVARTAAVRRRAGAARAPAGKSGEPIEFGGFHLDPEAGVLTRQGQSVSLTPSEAVILCTLARHRNQPVSRDDLMRNRHGCGHDPSDRTIDVLVSRLRQKIEPDPSQPRYIRTKRGVGYVFNVDEEPRHRAASA